VLLCLEVFFVGFKIVKQSDPHASWLHHARVSSWKEAHAVAYSHLSMTLVHAYVRPQDQHNSSQLYLSRDEGVSGLNGLRFLFICRQLLICVEHRQTPILASEDLLWFAKAIASSYQAKDLCLSSK